VTTVQGPQHRRTIQGASRQYEIPLQLRYKATSKQGPLYGLGQSRLISSRDITFSPSDGLTPGMNADIAVDWPRLLDGRIRVQLALQVTIIGTQEGVAEARIMTYDFRIAGLAEVETPTCCTADPPALAVRQNPRPGPNRPA
jgi:hypothetical protein